MAMMGQQPPRQERLFYPAVSVEQRVRATHPLRQIAQTIDFDFIYAKVADRYGANGHVSVPPPVILKLMLLLVLYNVRSERELLATLPERLDWLWFLGYDLDSAIPDHSVLSKARRLWGVAVFQGVFERIVAQCVEAGLVDGRKIFLDASFIDADASNASVVDTPSLKRYLNKRYRELEARLTERDAAPTPDRPYRTVNSRYVSTTDPEAAIVRQGAGKPKLRYATHRAVDGRSEIITATTVTPGDVNEAHLLVPLVEAHRLTTTRAADTVVADSKYGTQANFLACADRGLRAHLPDLSAVAARRTAARKLFLETAFRYDPATDTYACPANNSLKRKSVHQARQSVDYAAPPSVCAACALRSQCTTNRAGRTITRHLRQDVLDQMRTQAHAPPAKRDLRMRQHLMERSFARATRYGFDRARWRGLWRVQIQEYLVSTIQNIQVLLRYGRDQTKHPAVALPISDGSQVAHPVTAVRSASRRFVPCRMGLASFQPALAPI
jgi:transposase